ncbi:MAG: pyrimidine-nucleoside phosphorylase [Lentisphaerae bacterium GWF2_52_8]|nr:MAG: pyrimidine-nucleoside phosphorylase [Lentisphaerae bacterium GWF2_52_8]
MLRAYDIIMKKRNSGSLSREEISFMIKNYTSGVIPDYQMSALLMAIFIRGMNPSETAVLTDEMVKSGEVVDMSGIPGIKVDKHSTGGVGDKISLPLAPLVASCGAHVPMMSGRGLGHTGGTLDKLESIPGYRAVFPKEDFIRIVKSAGAAIVGQTGDLAPADKKLYALRDVTATVDSIPLIAASIMSKKIAAGPDALVLDVKTGNGAFMQKFEDALALAKTMVEIGINNKKDVMAMITDMNQPLGRLVGNSLEVIESIKVLRGEDIPDLRELVLAQGSYMLLMSKVAPSLAEARSLLERNITNGRGLEYFAKMIEAQGGNPDVTKDLSLLPVAGRKTEYRAGKAGYISEMLALEVGRAALALGAGREDKDSLIDNSVGFELVKKRGDAVSAGDVIAVIYYNDEAKLKNAAALLDGAVKITAEKPAPRPLIYNVIRDGKVSGYNCGVTV